MGTFARNTILVLWVWLMLAGVCLGKQVYLRDGAIVECESMWRRDGLVYVKINRDTVVAFTRNEIDPRTYRHGGKKQHRGGHKKPAGAVVLPGAAQPASKTAAEPVPAKLPVTAVAPVAKPAPLPSTATAAKPVPPQPAKPAAPTSPADVAKPMPTPTPAPAAKEEARPEPAAQTSSDPPAPPSKEEVEKVRKQSAEMMAEAIQKKDAEMMKKAMELQKSTIPQNDAQVSGMSIKILLLILVISLLIVISTWVVFEKGGEAGWKSLVPIYNLYILMEIAGKPGWWFILLIIPFVGAVFYLLAMLALAERFGRGALFGIGLTFLPMFFFPLLAFGGSQAEA